MNHAAVLQIPPHIRERLIKALETGLAPYPCTAVGLRSALGNAEVLPASIQAINAVARYGVDASCAAAWLRSVSAASSASASPDLVWSGPEVPGVHARDTRRVYEELQGTFKTALWLSTYAFFDGPKAFELLARRLDEDPSLDVWLLLNIQRPKGDTSMASDVVRRFTDTFWTHDWPGVTRPRVYFDPRSLELNTTRGVLHAKAVVADDEVVFITSANMTEAAFDRNFELGVLSRDRALAASVARHFQALIDQGLLSPLPQH
ncbi:DISARM system phospholipase D-like protein DrmC [Mucisphaera sp.]|uniref:DISARM system phospholipase D-like protein DrmC n=1 Tax=Mucisphaera sp. TaxID=2913024 RepID=UPI003D0D4963